jgi:hypothetical protein
MKKLYTLLTFLFFTFILFGQAPVSFKYQAVLRDASGTIKANTATTVTIEILRGRDDGNMVYSETHNVTTDKFGLINIEIGRGENPVGAMSEINWGANSYFVRTSIDGVALGSNQLLSVPYALYSNESAKTLSAGILFQGTVPDLDSFKTLSWDNIMLGNAIRNGTSISGSICQLSKTEYTWIAFPSFWGNQNFFYEYGNSSYEIIGGVHKRFFPAASTGTTDYQLWVFETVPDIDVNLIVNN